MPPSIVETEPHAAEVFVTDDELVVHLVDGRDVSVPLAWYPLLLHASTDERNEWELIGDGAESHWESHWCRVLNSP